MTVTYLTKKKALESTYIPYLFFGAGIMKFSSLYTQPRHQSYLLDLLWMSQQKYYTISLPSFLPSVRPVVQRQIPSSSLINQPTNQPIKSPPSQSNSTILPPPAFTLIITIITITITITITIPTNNPSTTTTTTQSTPRTIPQSISHKHISVAIATFRCPSLV